MTKDSKAYAELAKKAENSVTGISDPELKKIAFAKILETLLGNNQQPGAARPVRRSRTQASEKSGPQAYIEDLLKDGFFEERRTIAEVKTALANGGHHIPLTSLSGPLQKLCKRKLLRRVKVKVGEKKQSFAYSKW